MTHLKLDTTLKFGSMHPTFKRPDLNSKRLELLLVFFPFFLLGHSHIKSTSAKGSYFDLIGRVGTLYTTK